MVNSQVSNYIVLKVSDHLQFDLISYMTFAVNIFVHVVLVINRSKRIIYRSTLEHDSFFPAIF